MSLPARFSPAASREFLRALRDMEHAAAADRLKRVVDEAMRDIGRHPAIGRHQPVLADARYRFWSLSGGLSYVIVYRADLTPPAIVRFVHAARDLPVLLAELRDPAAPDDAP